MARTVDFENLSDDDLQYLSERTWLISDAELNGHTGVRTAVHAFLAGERQAANEEAGEVIQYKDGTVAELRAELERRGLDTTGKKPELVARLEDDDLAADEEDDEEDDDTVPAADDEEDDD